MKLFSEQGESFTWSHGQVRLLGEYRADADAIRERYWWLTANLGRLGTEVVRFREVLGSGTDARTIRGEHSYIFPPQEDTVLLGTTGDGHYMHTTRDYSTEVFGVRYEDKETPNFDTLAVQANIGVVLGMDGESSVLQVYDLMGNSRLSAAQDLVLREFEEA